MKPLAKESTVNTSQFCVTSDNFETEHVIHI